MLVFVRIINVGLHLESMKHGLRETRAQDVQKGNPVVKHFEHRSISVR